MPAGLWLCVILWESAYVLQPETVMLFIEIQPTNVPSGFSTSAISNPRSVQAMPDTISLQCFTARKARRTITALSFRRWCPHRGRMGELRKDSFASDSPSPSSVSIMRESHPVAQRFQPLKLNYISLTTSLWSMQLEKSQCWRISDLSGGRNWVWYWTSYKNWAFWGHSRNDRNWKTS